VSGSHPERTLPIHLWPEIITLPATISKLTAVRELELYGSHLVSLPPEIGAMSSLRSFDPYTSRRLHWLPYEITRCAALTDSRVSTRHLYGNIKNRLPFPRLPAELPVGSRPQRCSVCDGPFTPTGPIQRWVSLWVATDVMPLLVHACSDRCVEALPNPADHYVDHPHEGGRELRQPSWDYGDYATLYVGVRIILNRHDPAHLNRVVAPEDEWESGYEYDSVVDAILPRLGEATSGAGVQKVLHEEFTRLFGDVGMFSLEDFEPVAADVWQAWSVFPDGQSTSTAS
jgi:hypothetical protein